MIQGLQIQIRNTIQGWATLTSRDLSDRMAVVIENEIEGEKPWQKEKN